MASRLVCHSREYSASASSVSPPSIALPHLSAIAIAARSILKRPYLAYSRRGVQIRLVVGGCETCMQRRARLKQRGKRPLGVIRRLIGAVWAGQVSSRLDG